MWFERNHKERKQKAPENISYKRYTEIVGICKAEIRLSFKMGV